MSEEIKDDVKVDDVDDVKVDDNLADKEDVSGLKSALQKEREARKAAEKQAKALADEKSAAEQKSLEEKGQWKELAEKRKEKLTALETKLIETEKSKKAESILAHLTDDPKQSKILRDLILNNLEYADGEVSIAGIAEVETDEQLREYYKENYPFLCKGNKAVGGGATGNKGGGTSGNVLTQEQFDALPPGEKMVFFTQKGGKIKQ